MIRRSVLFIGAAINFVIALLMREQFGEMAAPVAASYAISMLLLWIGLSVNGKSK